MPYLDIIIYFMPLDQSITRQRGRTYVAQHVASPPSILIMQLHSSSLPTNHYK